MDSIQKDVVRTYPELHFFSEENGACQQVLRNILFMYAKLNPGVQYVQVKVVQEQEQHVLSAICLYPLITNISYHAHQRDYF